MSPALALFTSCVVSGVLVPVPEDVPLLLAGLAVARGEMPFAVALLAGGLGTLGRDVGVYGAGRLAGPRVRAFVDGRPRLHRAVGRLQARSVRQREGIVFLTRFAVGARAPLFFAAGLLGVGSSRFLLLDVLGLAITTPVCLWAGMRYGDASVALMEQMLVHQRPVLLAVACGLAAGWLARGWRKRRAVAKQRRYVKPEPPGATGGR